MASTYHFAAARSESPDERRWLLEAGLDAAASALGHAAVARPATEEERVAAIVDWVERTP